VQETEEEAVVILDLQDEDQTGENDRSAIEDSKKTKAEIKETPESPFLQKRVIRRVNGKLLEREDSLGEKKERTIKQSFKRILLLPAQVISTSVFCIWLCFAFLFFDDPEEDEN
jgi:Fe2+ transport system protein B